MIMDYCEIPNTIEWHEPEPSWATQHRSEVRALKGAELEFAAALAASAGRVQISESQNPKDRFLRLADEWSQETGHISSASDLINNSSYQQIIKLGWAAVPYLLDDLERNKRFWFPALAAITGLRPFDPADASNYQRMTEAWLRWGRRKGLI